jgi:hypothetical protein
MRSGVGQLVSVVIAISHTGADLVLSKHTINVRMSLNGLGLQLRTIDVSFE